MMHRVLLLAGIASANSAKQSCHSVSSQIPDDWCDSNCNNVPPNCPAEYCECDSPVPTPTPPAPPTPTPAPTPPAPPTPAPPPGKKAIIGYWGSAADLPAVSQVPEALRRGYNVVCVAFGDTMAADGSFQIHTNLGDPPTKASLSSSAGVSDDTWQYLISFGGQNAAGPAAGPMYVSGFLDAYHAAKAKYGFDGIDIDIETGMSTSLLEAYREIFKQLHAEGQITSMAPQPLNIDPVEVPVFMEGAYNAYVPLVDTTMIDYVTYVAPQMYNNGMPLGSIEKYIASLQSSAKIDWNGESLVVNIPSSKLVFGYPAANGAAPAGAAAGWEESPAALVAHYRSSPALMATGGAMTWSIDWDATTGWKWIDAVKGLWSTEDVVV